MAIPKSRIFLTGLDRQPMDIDLNEGTPWIQAVLERSAPDPELSGYSAIEWAKKSKINGQLHLEKLAGGGDEYRVQGSFSAWVPSICARCGDAFEAKRDGKFDVYVKKLVSGADSEDSGDPDLLYLQGQELDLVELLSEQLIILEPYAEVPDFDAHGNPHTCKKIETISSGQEAPVSTNSAFSKLAVLKKGGL